MFLYASLHLYNAASLLSAAVTQKRPSENWRIPVSTQFRPVCTRSSVEMPYSILCKCRIGISFGVSRALAITWISVSQAWFQVQMRKAKRKRYFKLPRLVGSRQCRTQRSQGYLDQVRMRVDLFGTGYKYLMSRRVMQIRK